MALASVRHTSVKACSSPNNFVVADTSACAQPSSTKSQPDQVIDIDFPQHFAYYARLTSR
jgi:hypothetical protein